MNLSSPLPVTSAQPLIPKASNLESSIRDSAQKFESFLIQQMFREMRNSPIREQMSDSSMTYRGIAEDQLAEHLAQSGGFGFGKAMADQLLAQIKASGLSGTPLSAVNQLTNPTS
jgi:Rod binding domain-containing protein